MEHKNIRYAVYLLICMLVLTCTPVANWLTSEPAARAILFLQTGHILRSPPKAETPPQTLPPVTTQATQPTVAAPTFSSADAKLVKVNSYCGYTTDVPAWLETPLSWDLQQTAPTVLILHSHATECYADGEKTNYRTQDTDKNMVSVGDALGAKLEAAGIRVLHDRSLHDSPSYNAAYENSRASAKAYLEEYPSISLVLDLHRDAVTDSDGKQIKYTLQTNAGTAAKMMFVVGTDAGGLRHNNWPENMSLAVKLMTLLQRENPGICRPISFRTQRFNQDLSTGALLIEMGSAGNSRQEVLVAAELLADAIIALSKGTS